MVPQAVSCVIGMQQGGDPNEDGRFVVLKCKFSKSLTSIISNRWSRRLVDGKEYVFGDGKKKTTSFCVQLFYTSQRLIMNEAQNKGALFFVYVLPPCIY